MLYLKEKLDFGSFVATYLLAIELTPTVEKEGKVFLVDSRNDPEVYVL